jgi:hypothetical protein
MEGVSEGDVELGAREGECDGWTVGDTLGADKVGLAEGCRLGVVLGLCDGLRVGVSLGLHVGIEVGKVGV